MNEDLKLSFHKAMLNIYVTAKKDLGYNATRFLQMLSSPDESIRTAKRFVLSSKPSDGFAELCMRNRLDLTVEALVAFEPAYAQLFTDEERQAARARLAELGYKP